MSTYTVPEISYFHNTNPRYPLTAQRGAAGSPLGPKGSIAESSEKAKVEEGNFDRRKQSNTLKNLHELLPAKRRVYDYFEQDRHENNGVVPEKDDRNTNMKWRIKDRSKFSGCGFVLCLNIGVDPPDVNKPKECAKLECWVDPTATSKEKAKEAISANLKKQYQSWYKNAMFNYTMDPTTEEVQKLFLGLRRSFASNRVLFHYNGHGVPKPTERGELWVFNEGLRKYIPLSMKEVQSWVGKPSLYVFDCNGAGVLLDFLERGKSEPIKDVRDSKFQLHSVHSLNTEVIAFGACGESEMLPLSDTVPADLFTSCLTTPVKMALRWACTNSIFLSDIDESLLDKIPGKQGEKATPFGELNWIFTAITDTIAWSVLPKELFHKLFRQDLLIAAISRNFLLACRIMRKYRCTPCSYPVFPETHNHPLWESWDLAAERIICQMPNYVKDSTRYPIKNTGFFAEQLEGFKIRLSNQWKVRVFSYPELPIILQTLLNHEHRIKALDLLSHFADGGVNCVHQTLLVGLFPYINKMLSYRKTNFEKPLMEIWAKCVAFDPNFQIDLVKDDNFMFFIAVLGEFKAKSAAELTRDEEGIVTNAIMILTMTMLNHLGQAGCYKGELMSLISKYINSEYQELRKWVCLCWGGQFKGYQKLNSQEGKVVTTLEQVYSHDPDPEVRAAAVFVLGNFFEKSERTFNSSDTMSNIGIKLLVAMEDASPLVRKEAVIAIGKLIRMYMGDFVQAVKSLIRTQLGASVGSPIGRENERMNDEFEISISFCQCMWSSLVQQASDPYYEIAQIVQSICSLVVSRIPGDYSLGSIIEMTLNDSATPVAPVRTFRQKPKIKEKTKKSTKSAFNLNGANSPVGAGSPTTGAHGILEGAGGPNAAQDTSADEMNMHGNQAKGWGRGVNLPRVKSMDISSLRTTGDGSHFERSTSHDFNASKRADRISEDWDSVLLQSSFFDYCVEKFNKAGSLERSRERSSCTYFSRARASDVSTGASGAQDFNTPEKHENVDDTVSPPSEQTEMSDESNAIPAPLDGSLRDVRYAKMETNVLKYTNTHYTMQQTGSLNTSALISRNLKFHTLEPLLVSSDENNNIRVYNYENNKKISEFVGAVTGTSNSLIDSLELINEAADPLLLVGSGDGIIRIWKNYSVREKDEKLVSAFRAFHMGSKKVLGVRMIAKWLQNLGLIFVAGGGQSSVNIFDAEREMCISAVQTASRPSCLSVHLGDSPRMFAVGMYNGAINFYDSRVPKPFNMVRTFQGHASMILNLQIKIAGGGSLKLISGSVQGDIRIWDIRNTNHLASFDVEGISELTIHPYLPLMACGSGKSNNVSLFTTVDDNISRAFRIGFFDGILPYSSAVPGSMEFHYFRPIFSCTKANHPVHVFKGRKS